MGIERAGKRSAFAASASLCVTILVATGALMWAQSLPLEPQHESGSRVTGAFEGWFRNPDGSFSLLLGSYNRSWKQEVELPMRQNHRVDRHVLTRCQPKHLTVH